MKQMARNLTMEGCGILRDCRYLLQDRDTKYTRSFRAMIASGQIEPARAACPLSELECLCGALGQVGEGGVLVQGDPLGRVLPAAGAERIRRTLSCRAQSPGQGQRPAVAS